MCALKNGSHLFISVTVFLVFCLNGCSPSNTDEFPHFCPPGINDTMQLEKLCRWTDYTFPRYLWHFIVGYYCYNYTNPIRFINKETPKTQAFECNNQVIGLYVLENGENGGFIHFDYTNYTSLSYIQKLFKKTAYFENYVKCSEDAVKCCDEYMTNENIQIYPETCPVIWDSWTCFLSTPSNTIAKEVCSKQYYTTTSEVCELESKKECFEGGVWNQTTDYSPCSLTPVYRRRHIVHIYSFYVAIVFSTPAVIIFFAYAKLRNTTRVILHRNLLLMTVVRGILTVLIKNIVILDALSSNSNNVMVNNGVFCRTLAFLETTSINAIYASMLIDSYYLHKAYARVHKKDPKLIYLYAFVFAVTFIPSIIWATFKAVQNADSCWMVEENPYDQWILDGFRLAILGINTLLLIDIVRAYCMQMQMTRQAKEAFRATMILIPLFGINFIATANKKLPDKSCSTEDIYYYIFYPMQAAQGIMVALIFCYMNSQVQGEIRNSYRKLRIQLEQRYGWKVKRNINKRKMTTATMLGEDDK